MKTSICKLISIKIALQNSKKIKCNTLILTVFSFLFCLNTYSQNNSEEISQKENVIVSTEVDTSLCLQKIAAIDDHINAINIKIQFIINNPEEKALAESNGWFEQMDRTKKELILQKTDLQNKIKK